MTYYHLVVAGLVPRHAMLQYSNRLLRAPRIRSTLKPIQARSLSTGSAIHQHNSSLLYHQTQVSTSTTRKLSTSTVTAMPSYIVRIPLPRIPYKEDSHDADRCFVNIIGYRPGGKDRGVSFR